MPLPITIRSAAAGCAASKLEEIPGIGEKRRETLLKTFKSVRAVENASLTALEDAIGKAAGKTVYDYFHKECEEETP